MLPRFVIIAASALALTITGLGTAAAQPSMKTSNESETFPNKGSGWAELSSGVFVLTDSTDPDLVTRSAPAEAGRKLVLRVSERARLHTFRGNGDSKHLDNSDDGRLVVPGRKVRNRGALMFISVQANLAHVSARSHPRSTWIYIDTDARLKGGQLVGAEFPVPAAEPTDMWVVNSSTFTWNLVSKSNPTESRTLTPGTHTLLESYTAFAGDDWDLAFSLEREGSDSIEVLANNPFWGWPKISFGSKAVGFSAGEKCYWSAKDVYALGERSGTENFTKVFTLTLFDTPAFDTSAYSAC